MSSPGRRAITWMDKEEILLYDLVSMWPLTAGFIIRIFEIGGPTTARTLSTFYASPSRYSQRSRQWYPGIHSRNGRRHILISKDHHRRQKSGQATSLSQVPRTLDRLHCLQSQAGYRNNLYRIRIKARGHDMDRHCHLYSISVPNLSRTTGMYRLLRALQ